MNAPSRTGALTVTIGQQSKIVSKKNLVWIGVLAIGAIGLLVGNALLVPRNFPEQICTVYGEKDAWRAQLNSRYERGQLQYKLILTDALGAERAEKLTTQQQSSLSHDEKGHYAALLLRHKNLYRRMNPPNQLKLSFFDVFGMNVDSLEIEGFQPTKEADISIKGASTEMRKPVPAKAENRDWRKALLNHDFPAEPKLAPANEDLRPDYVDLFQEYFSNKYEGKCPIEWQSTDRVERKQDINPRAVRFEVVENSG